MRPLTRWRIRAPRLPERLTENAPPDEAFHLPGADALSAFADLLGTSPDLVEEEVRRRITLSGVKRALPTLPPRERLVLSLRYGLKDGAVHPQHEIAKMLGISRSYVSRVEKHAVELLREALERDAGKP